MQYKCWEKRRLNRMLCVYRREREQTESEEDEEARENLRFEEEEKWIAEEVEKQVHHYSSIFYHFPCALFSFNLFSKFMIKKSLSYFLAVFILWTSKLCCSKSINTFIIIYGMSMYDIERVSVHFHIIVASVKFLVDTAER